LMAGTAGYSTLISGKYVASQASPSSLSLAVGKIVMLLHASSLGYKEWYSE
jgi:hypothetical protein